MEVDDALKVKGEVKKEEPTPEAKKEEPSIFEI
jgi:hypothetical protein